MQQKMNAHAILFAVNKKHTSNFTKTLLNEPNMQQNIAEN